MGIFSVKMIQWLSKNVPGRTYNEITPLFNIRFDTEFTPSQIKRCCNSSGIKTGRKGHKNNDHKVGTERIIDKRSGIIYIKTSNKPTKGCSKLGLAGTWRQKHLIIWEAANGKVPKGHLIIFADRNKTNFDIENLLLVSKREFFYMIKYSLLTNNTELTRTNHVIAKHNLAIIDAVGRLTECKKHYAVKDKYRRFLLRNNPRRILPESRCYETP
jgi:hypothetical protein